MRPRNRSKDFPAHGKYGIEYHGRGFVIVKSLANEHASTDGQMIKVDVVYSQYGRQLTVQDWYIRNTQPISLRELRARGITFSDATS